MLQRLELKAEPLRKLPEAALLEELDAAAALSMPEIRKAFLAAVKAAIGETDYAQFELALSYGDVSFALKAIPWDKFSEALRTAFGDGSGLIKTFERGAQLGLKLIPGGAGGPPASFDHLAFRAVQYIQGHGAQLVKDVTEETRTGIRLLLEAAYKEPRSIADTAREIRTVLTTRQANGLIGLNSKQGAALSKKIAAWVDEPDLSAKRIQQLIDREYRKQLKYRAQLISHTEAYNAGNEGLLQTWKDMDREGTIHIKGLGAYFVSDLGERALRPGLHPRCWCVSRLVRKKDSAEVVYVREWVARVVGVCARCKAMDGKLAAA